MLVVEKLLSEDKSSPLETHLQSIALLLLTEGRNRTSSKKSDLSALFSAAGFKEIQTKQADLYHVVFGRK